MDFGSIPDILHRLRQAHLSSVSASGLHRFALNPPLAEADVTSFERNHGIRLPADYRRFLTEFGNGGPGPDGLFPLGYRMVLRSVEAWRAGDIGILAEPFPHTRPWNGGDKPDPDSLPPDEYDETLEEWRERYHDRRLMDGAVPLASLGCGLTDWLVVTGPEAGHMWGDYRADLTGIVPLAAGGRPRIEFAEWYLSWLDAEVAALEGRQPTMARPRPVTHPRDRQPSLFDGLEQ